MKKKFNQIIMSSEVTNTKKYKLKPPSLKSIKTITAQTESVTNTILARMRLN